MSRSKPRVALVHDELSRPGVARTRAPSTTWGEASTLGRTMKTISDGERGDNQDHYLYTAVRKRLLTMIYTTGSGRVTASDTQIRYPPYIRMV